MEQMKRNLEHFWLFHKKAVIVLGVLLLVIAIVL